MNNLSQVAIYGCVALGGAAGSMLRMFLASWVQSSTAAVFPYGILLVNLLGCFLIGLLGEVLVPLKSVALDLWRVTILVGLLGGFTTFSTFSNDNVRLLQAGHYAAALLNMVVSMTGGVLLAALGWWLGKLWLMR